MSSSSISSEGEWLWSSKWSSILELRGKEMQEESGPSASCCCEPFQAGPEEGYALQGRVRLSNRRQVV